MSKAVMHGLDLSHWNLVRDFDAIAKDYNFVMLKLGGEEGSVGKLNIDKCFLDYYKKAKGAGLNVGCYFYMSDRKRAINDDPRRITSQITEFIDKNKMQFEMPVAIDVEGKKEATRTDITDYVYEWCYQMETYGYYVSIYGSDLSTFNDLVDISKLSRFDKWVARYNSNGPQYVKKFGMWQYTSSQRANGAVGVVDANYAYYDYPTIIKNKSLNNF